MNSFVRRTLCGTLFAGGILILGAGTASANDNPTTTDLGLLSDTQINLDPGADVNAGLDATVESVVDGALEDSSNDSEGSIDSGLGLVSDANATVDAATAVEGAIERTEGAENNNGSEVASDLGADLGLNMDADVNADATVDGAVESTENNEGLLGGLL